MVDFDVLRLMVRTQTQLDQAKAAAVTDTARTIMYQFTVLDALDQLDELELPKKEKE